MDCIQGPSWQPSRPPSLLPFLPLQPSHLWPLTKPLASPAWTLSETFPCLRPPGHPPEPLPLRFISEARGDPVSSTGRGTAEVEGEGGGDSIPSLSGRR